MSTEHPSRAAGRGRPPSLRDVADRAQVSHQTVSRVINDFPGVRPMTRERVLAAIDELGYRRNNAARTLVTRRSGLIGVIAVGSFLFGPTSTLAAIQEAARKNGYMPLLATLRENSQAALIEAVDEVLDHGIEALVVIASRESMGRRTAELRPGVPVIVVGPNPAEADDLATLSVDQSAGATAAIEHLAGLGHRRVVLLAGPQDWVDAQQRLTAAQRCCDDHGIVSQVLLGDWSAASGFAAGRALLAQWAADHSGPLPTAVFAANDHMALVLLAAFHAAGVEVPADISVVGFDDIAGADYFIPPLTTIRQNFDALGHQVLLATLSALAGETVDLTPAPAQLCVRSSTAPPRA